MTPFYERDGITVYHGNCLEITPNLPSRVDCIITDPPFFMPATHYQSRVKWQRAWADTSILATFWGQVLEKSLPRLKETGHFVTFCNGESYPVFYPEMFKRFDALACLVWDKLHFGLGRCWRHQHELMIAGRWSTSVFYEDGSARSDIFRCKATKSQERMHPVEKPVALLCELMKPITQPGDVILDMFMGSGSTLRAAQVIGRRAIGIEADEDYCKIAVERLRQPMFWSLPSEATEGPKVEQGALL